jgi:hypothetical protein
MIVGIAAIDPINVECVRVSFMDTRGGPGGAVRPVPMSLDDLSDFTRFIEAAESAFPFKVLALNQGTTGVDRHELYQSWLVNKPVIDDLVRQAGDAARNSGT